MNKEINMINWFDIPVNDLERAKYFYHVVFSIRMEDMNMPGWEMAGFPYEVRRGKVAGALVKGSNSNPSADGVMVYLNANPAITVVLSRIEQEGGQIILGKTQIGPEIGYMAFFY